MDSTKKKRSRSTSRKRVAKAPIIQQIPVPVTEIQYPIQVSCNVSILFFPSKNSENVILDLLNKAITSVDICVYLIVHPDFIQTIKNIASKGIKVRLITDVNNTGNLRSIFDGTSNIQMKTDTTKSALVHNKFVVIDNSITITGSFNWTKRAVNDNEENVVILYGEPSSSIFTTQFETLWNNFVIF